MTAIIIISHTYSSIHWWTSKSIFQFWRKKNFFFNSNRNLSCTTYTWEEKKFQNWWVGCWSIVVRLATLSIHISIYYYYCSGFFHSLTQTHTPCGYFTMMMMMMIRKKTSPIIIIYWYGDFFSRQLAKWLKEKFHHFISFIHLFMMVMKNHH